MARANADGTVTLQSANDKYKPQTLTCGEARELQIHGILHTRMTVVRSAS